MSTAIDLGAADDRVFLLIEAALGTEDLDVAVHAARKGLKRLRSHLRLRRAALPPGVYDEKNAELRAIGRMLAPARDAFVLAKTLDGLEQSAGWVPVTAIIAAHHQKTMAALLDGPLQDARRRIDEATMSWPAVTELGQQTVADSIATTYERGKATQALAARSGRAQAFHNWRKRVKTLRYQLEVVDGDERVIQELTELGDWLGDEHDHTVFIEFCDDRLDLLPDRRDRYVLIDRAERRRDQLRSRALGSTVYSSDSTPFVGLVGLSSGAG